MAYDLQPFLRRALEQGEAKHKIAAALTQAGWPEEEINAALDKFVEIDGFSLPVPRREPYLPAREAFLYLVLFLTLYITAVSFGSLLFSLVNRALPDMLNNPYQYTNVLSTIRTSTASLLITFPIFLVLNHTRLFPVGRRTRRTFPLKSPDRSHHRRYCLWLLPLGSAPR